VYSNRVADINSGRQIRITIRNAAFDWSRNANVKMQPRENRCGHCV